MAMEPSDEEMPGADASAASPPGESPATTPSAESSAGPPAESTVGTGSVIGLGCTIVILLITCIGVAIFMWRQVH
jgi:hypothetical protein